MRIPWRPAQTDEREWMDDAGHDPEVIRENLGDLRRVNRLLGGVRLTLEPLKRFAAPLPPTETLWVLDIGTGAADIPRAIVRWVRGERRKVCVIASDVSPAILHAARQIGAVPPELLFVAADATALPFRDGSVHVATCSLTLHHLSPAEGVAMLAEMKRCSRCGVVVNDIVRSWLVYAGATLAARLGSRNYLTWHDGPLSVRRAFTVGEMRSLARRAGLVPVHWDSFLFYRVALSAV